MSRADMTRYPRLFLRNFEQILDSSVPRCYSILFLIPVPSYYCSQSLSFSLVWKSCVSYFERRYQLSFMVLYTEEEREIFRPKSNPDIFMQALGG